MFNFSILISNWLILSKKKSTLNLECLWKERRTVDIYYIYTHTNAVCIGRHTFKRERTFDFGNGFGNSSFTSITMHWDFKFCLNHLLKEGTKLNFLIQGLINSYIYVWNEIFTLIYNYVYIYIYISVCKCKGLTFLCGLCFFSLALPIGTAKEKKKTQATTRQNETPAMVYKRCARGSLVKDRWLVLSVNSFTLDSPIIFF